MDVKADIRVSAVYLWCKSGQKLLHPGESFSRIHQSLNCQKFPNVLSSWKFITMFTRRHHLSLSGAQLIPSTLHIIFQITLLILSSHPLSVCPSGLFHSGFSIKISTRFPLLSHASYMSCPSNPPWLYHSNYIWRTAQVMKLRNCPRV
jgi:hypothetical protein